MRKYAVIALVILLSSAGLWYVRTNRSRTSPAGSVIAGNVMVDVNDVSASAGRTITGNLNVDGVSPFADRTPMLRGALAVEGDLHARPLPNGKLVLEGNLRVTPTKR